MLVIKTFGPLTVELGHQPVTLSKHASALIALLATSLDRRVDRDHAIELLWDYSDIRKARHSLSQLLYTLRRLLPEGALQADSKWMLLKAEKVSSDYASFYAALKEQHLELALQQYGGRFLESASYLTDEFDDWRLSHAARAEIEATAACIALVNAALDGEDHHRAAELAKRGMIINPDSVYLARVRVESLASAGDIALALRDYELARRHFKITTGAVPDLLSDQLGLQVARLPSLQQSDDPDVAVPKLVGRTAEIRALRRQWEQAINGCRVALLRGLPGTGKSRLLQHITRRAVLENARAFLFSCSEAESQLAYSGIVGVIREGFRQEDLDGLAVGWQQALARLAPELLTLESGGSDSPRILWEAVAQYFANVTRRNPVVLAVDDYHWLDGSSREVLTYIAKRLLDRPILVLAATRDREPPPIYEDDRDLAVAVDLPVLTGTELDEVLSDMSRRVNLEIDDDARRMLLERTAGRPFFLVQIMRHLRDMGVQRCSLDTVQDLLPPSIESYISRRIGALGPVARSVAAAAAVLHRDAPVQLLSRVIAQSSIVTADAVDSLVGAGILADASHVRFSHELIREATISSMSRSHRTFWHARWAEALGTQEYSRPHEIAFHFEEAGDAAAAFKAAYAAADQALRLRDYVGAEDQYKRMARCGDADGRLFAQGELLKLRYRLGIFRESDVFLSSLKTYFDSKSDSEGLVACAMASYWVAERRGGLSQSDSVNEAKRIVSLAEQHAPGQIAAVMWQLADAMRRYGEYGTLGRFANALQLKSQDASTDSASAAEMLTVAALLTGLSDGFVSALRLAERAVELAEHAHDPLLMVRAVYARGTARVWGGDLCGARSDYDYVLECGDTTLHEELVVRVKSNYAVILMEQGDYRAAESYALAALREAGAARRGYAYGNLALLHLRSGNTAACRHYCQALLSCNDASPQQWIDLHVDGLLGLADLVDGDISAARVRADRVRLRCGDDYGVVDRSHLYVLLAKVALIDGDSETAEGVLMAGITCIENKEAIAGARLRCALAEVLVAKGDLVRAKAVIDDTIATARKGGIHALVEDAERLRL